MALTRGFSVVREIRYEQGLCVHYNDGVRRNVMDSVESVDLLGPGVVKVLRNLNISEIDLQKEV
jgi:hypothetical protein